MRFYEKYGTNPLEVQSAGHQELEEKTIERRYTPPSRKGSHTKTAEGFILRQFNNSDPCFASRTIYDCTAKRSKSQVAATFR